MNDKPQQPPTECLCVIPGAVNKRMEIVEIVPVKCGNPMPVGHFMCAAHWGMIDGDLKRMFHVVQKREREENRRKRSKEWVALAEEALGQVWRKSLVKLHEQLRAETTNGEVRGTDEILGAGEAGALAASRSQGVHHVHAAEDGSVEADGGAVREGGGGSPDGATAARAAPAALRAEESVGG